MEYLSFTATGTFVIDYAEKISFTDACHAEILLQGNRM
jgi:hypothetical protein